MPRDQIPLVIDDAASFADRLRTLWPADSPGHVSALQTVASAAGYRSWQELRAREPAAEPLTPVETRRLAAALRMFDSQGRMSVWPQKTNVQGLCLMAFWSRLPARRPLTEPEVNAVLLRGERFGDHVLLRRSLIDHGLVSRAIDGSVYRRIERRPDAPERALIRELSERWIAAEAARDG